MPLPNEEHRPRQEAVSGVIVADGDTSKDTRCRRCGRRIWSSHSVALGLGGRCRSAVDGPIAAESPTRSSRVEDLALRGELGAGSTKFSRPRPTPLAWTASYLAAELRESLPNLRLHLLTMQERHELEVALSTAARAVDSAMDAANLRGGWIA